MAGTFYTAMMEDDRLNVEEQPEGLRIPDNTHWKKALRIFKEYCEKVHCPGTLYSNDLETEDIRNSWDVELKATLKQR